MKLFYDCPVTEVLTIVQENAFLQSGENGSSESVSYDDDPFAE